MKRAVLIVLLAAVGAGAALGSGSAGAGESSSDTIVTSRPLAGGGYKLAVTAAPGQANFVTSFACEDGVAYKCVRDDVGVTDDSPKCTQESPTEVRCKLRGLRKLVIDTGDMNDTLSLQELPDFEFQQPSDATVVLGRGRDNATIAGRARVSGGGGGDALRGRRRNQRLFGGRGGDRVTCGRGRDDVGNGQRGNDSGGAGCETKISL